MFYVHFFLFFWTWKCVYRYQSCDEAIFDDIIIILRNASMVDTRYEPKILTRRLIYLITVYKNGYFNSYWFLQYLASKYLNTFMYIFFENHNASFLMLSFIASKNSKSWCFNVAFRFYRIFLTFRLIPKINVKTVAAYFVVFKRVSFLINKNKN